MLSHKNLMLNRRIEFYYRPDNLAVNPRN
jgi:hypothetical protein